MTDNIQPHRRLRSDATLVLRDCTAWHARLAARRLSAYLDSRLAPAGLSATQFGLMALLAAASDDTLGALSRRAGLDQSTLSRNMDVLARLGWVEITRAGRDRRKRAAWLTEAGAIRLAEAMPLWRAAQDELSRLLDVSLAQQLGEAAMAAPLAP